MNKESKKTLLSVLLFLPIFGALWTLATFYDLDVSHLLADCNINESNFFSDSAYGNFFETCGMFPAYCGTAFVCIVAFWFLVKSGLKKPLRILGGFVAFVLGVYFLKDAFYDVFRYPLRHVEQKLAVYGTEHIISEYGYPNVSLSDIDSTFSVIEYFLSALVFSLGILAVKNVPWAVWKKLILFAVAYSVMAYCSGETVSLAKHAVGRVRYRTLYWSEQNGLGGFADYTPWYVATDNADKYSSYVVSLYGDWSNSFPSAHTASAGFSYAIIMLIDVLGIKNKGKKILLWAVPIVWTGMTAVGRILVGAHYFSDVLIGGTCSFVFMILSREIFICRFSHIRCFFKKSE